MLTKLCNRLIAIKEIENSRISKSKRKKLSKKRRNRPSKMICCKMSCSARNRH